MPYTWFLEITFVWTSVCVWWLLANYYSHEMKPEKMVKQAILLSCLYIAPAVDFAHGHGSKVHLDLLLKKTKVRL